MRFLFDKAACQNTRRALRREWLLTNGLGDYASSSMLNCNTRKYHGLLVAHTPYGRHVLLSALEESLVGEERSFCFSVRQHPMTLNPSGHHFQESFEFDRRPVFTYRFGNARIVRECLLVRGETRLIIRWSITGSGMPPTLLRLRPLLAYRSFHSLTRENANLHVRTTPVDGGFSISPYDGLPPLYVQGDGLCRFMPVPDWYRDVEYQMEHERGFDYKEDLFAPGIVDLPLAGRTSLYLTVGTSLCEENIEALWARESAAQDAAHAGADGMIGHLAAVGNDVLVDEGDGRPSVLAGYHWFDAWGRDTLISLPGLTFCAGRTQAGLDVLGSMAREMKDGLVPNYLTPDGANAYNSADASLWFAFAVQSYMATAPEQGLEWVREHAWPALRAIVRGFRKGHGPTVFIDGDGILHAGDATTQLTWMDAMVDGRPVTPRHGCPVELNALWYNTLALTTYLDRKFGEPDPTADGMLLRRMRKAFEERFYVAEDGGYLGDVWRDGMLDKSVRPNQILAVSLPFPILKKTLQAEVVECVRDKLLTPFGLRTLCPDDEAYCRIYRGDAKSRDLSYHQGTVWPWLLGHYADALLKVARDKKGAVRALLDTVTPLLCDHLSEAGIGSISEVFDATPPYVPNGCIAQAWSVAECLRMLTVLKAAAPDVYAHWEKEAAFRLACTSKGDTADVCHAFLPVGGKIIAL